MTTIRDEAHAARVARAADEIERRLATLPDLGANLPDAQARAAARQAYMAAIGQMKSDMGNIALTTIRDDHNGCRVKLLGLSASATTGFASAAGNWIAQARAKLARFHAEKDTA